MGLKPQEPKKAIKLFEINHVPHMHCFQYTHTRTHTHTCVMASVESVREREREFTIGHDYQPTTSMMMAVYGKTTDLVELLHSCIGISHFK